jgi:hypothetical protein
LGINDPIFPFTGSEHGRMLLRLGTGALLPSLELWRTSQADQDPAVAASINNALRLCPKDQPQHVPKRAKIPVSFQLPVAIGAF